jgi:hypothetical protein
VEGCPTVQRTQLCHSLQHLVLNLMFFAIFLLELNLDFHALKAIEDAEAGIF